MDLKQSNTVELAVLNIESGISDDTNFSWRVKETLRCRDMIILKVRSKYWNTSHKLTILVPNTVKEAYEIDRKVGTNVWNKAIKQEMDNLRIAFKKFDSVTPDDMMKKKVNIVYKHVNVNMVF